MGLIHVKFFVVLFLILGYYDVNGRTDLAMEFTGQVQAYPNIMREKTECLPLKGVYTHTQSYVCDPDGLLTVSQINRLNDQLQETRSHESSGCSTTNPRPVIAVALVNKLKVGNENPERLLSYASIFAYHLFNEWNLPSCQTGSNKMIVFYSKEDGVIYTFAGELFERRLTSNQVIDTTIKSRVFFSHGIYEGLAYMIDEYQEIILRGKKL